MDSTTLVPLMRHYGGTVCLLVIALVLTVFEVVLSGCERAPTQISSPPSPYIAVDGTVHGIIDRGARTNVNTGWFFTGVGVVRHRCIVVGTAADMLGGNRVGWYDLDTGQWTLLDVEVISPTVQPLVGHSSDAFILVELDSIVELPIAEGGLRRYTAIDAASPAYGLGDTDWRVYADRQHGRLLATNVATGEQEAIHFGWRQVRAIGRTSSAVIVTDDRTVYSVTRLAPHGTWDVRTLGSMPMAPQSACEVQGSLWIVYSSDYPTRSYWVSADGSMVYVQSHGTVQAAVVTDN
jgi:hypothetical protein